jgi:hypothetical protein
VAGGAGAGEVPRPLSIVLVFVGSSDKVRGLRVGGRALAASVKGVRGRGVEPGWEYQLDAVLLIELRVIEKLRVDARSGAMFRKGAPMYIPRVAY